ncbi:DNA polymerase lambda-like [Ylistrum balloti]|uniref:DNA polymerase lambda-like n=1 Tax=Ylistrum balloti TaxID=509963 RepID=UPI0029059A92|nr:DNA polymerase lambda-like [Ylistrum balloti]
MTSKKRKLPESFHVTEPNKFLLGCKIYILKASIEKMRLQIFTSQLQKYGGIQHEQLESDTTHLVVDDKMEAERMCRILKVDKPPENIEILKTSWLSSCFKSKDMVPTKGFELDLSVFAKKDLMEDEDTKMIKDGDSSGSKSNTEGEIKPAKVGVMFRAYKKTKMDPEGYNDDPDSDYMASDHEEEGNVSAMGSDTTPQTSPCKTIQTSSWVCAQSSKNTLPNSNKHITDKLEEMVKTYESTSDKWRAYGYQKAIQALRRLPRPISSWQEAKDLPGVGTRLADKIWEIAESGELRKLNEFRSSDEVKVMEMFGNVWGAGAHTSRTWYQQGFRTLDDLRTKANLTHQQKIGLKHYDDILERMPRVEAGEIEAVVRTAAESLLPGVIAQACGSYRRKKTTCGDVDVLVTHPDGKSHRGIFGKLLTKLRDQGFLTDDLVTSEDDGNQKKYLGVCKLPGENRRHRRLDIIVVPYDEYACALVYFTGSAHFNRSLRHLAKKKGMSLSEHSLNVGVVRNGSEKVFEGTPVPTPTEESVLEKLGVPYRPPEERDH